MPLIIDGHNLIGTLPDIDISDPDDEARLVGRLRSYRARSGQPLIVFFDSGDPILRSGHPAVGGPPLASAASASPARGHVDRAPGGVQVLFAAPGQTADDAIVDYLHGRAEPGQYAVVTNDSELAQRARLAGASVVRASDFAGRLTRRRQRPVPTRPAGPDPHAPAYADLFAAFLHPGAEDARFGADLHAPPERWIDRLYGEDGELAQVAARWLGRLGGPPALEPLRDALTHGDRAVRAAAALALGDLANCAALPDLMRLLAHDAEAMVREAAAQTLGLIGDRGVEDALASAAASDPKSKVRKAARAALSQVRARRA